MATGFSRMATGAGWDPSHHHHRERVVAPRAPDVTAW